MKKSIVINVERGQERIALLEDEKLVEFFVNINVDKSLVGDIYLGYVQNILPGIQSAFVDIGRPKNAFLNINDIENIDIDADEVDSFNTEAQIGKVTRHRIEDILKPNQKIMIQVLKEEIGTKGPKVTTNVSIPGNFAVLMPQSPSIGVSRKIRNKDKRKVLYELAKKNVPEGMGLILRTSCEDWPEKVIVNEIRMLVNIWKEIQSKYHKGNKPAMIYRDLEPSEKIIRDTLAEGIETIVVDDNKRYTDIKKIFKNIKNIKTKIIHYREDIPVFESYGIEEALEKGISKVVNLDGGGTLVFDEAEALVAIDINTGHFVGRKSQEDTVFQTNMKAAEEIPRQLRLRDIGGIIIIDFIDMEREDHRNKVFETLKVNLKRDKAQTNIYPISNLGLVEMSRKRVRRSLKNQLTQSCPYCGGTGIIYSTSTLAFNLLRTLKKAFWLTNETEFLVILNQEIFYSMISEYRDALEDLQKKFKRKVYLSYNAEFHHHDIKIMSLQTKAEIISTLNTYDDENEVLF